MIKNKSELLQAANAWMATAGRDLQKHLKSFVQLVSTVRGVDLPIDTIARMFDEDPRTIEAILNGRVENVPMSLFAKLLIASNHAIQIIPVNQSPLPAMGRVAQHRCQRRGMQQACQAEHPQRPQPTPFGFMNPIGENLRPMGRVYNPETNSFVPQPQRPQPAPQNLSMDATPYPMPSQDEMLPDPEEIMEMARQDAIRDRYAEMGGQPEVENTDFNPFETEDDFAGEELLDENVPDTPDAEYPEMGIPDPAFGQTQRTENTNDDIMELARALRANPTVANLLRRLV